MEKEIKMKKIISTKNAPQAIGSYSQAVLCKDTLYCSGQIAINPESGNLIIDNIKNETNQIMKNIQEILKAAKMDFNNVVKSTIYMKNIDDYEQINETYSKYFNSHLPAREAMQISLLPKNVNLEISIIAVI